MKRWRLRLGLVVLLGVVAAAGLGLSLSIPYRSFEGEVFVTIERGSSTKTIGRILAESGVIRNPWLFLATRALQPSAKLQAGEYRFADPASVREVFARIARGDVYHFDFTVPEGSNIFDIARMVEELEIMPGAEFLKAASDASLIQDLAPGAKTLEGYLFPSTYRLTHATTAADLCRLMTQQFRKEWARLGTAEAPVQEIVTLASLVEKETGVAEERPLVAAVFSNRLKKPMRLDCDPTVIYAAMLEKHYDGVIHRSDLARQNAYNTYQNDGLPPGPIANPGAASLEAALRPAETTFLYFVARPEGGRHVFSSTLEAHQRAVQSYRHGNHSKSPPPKPPKAKGKAG